MRTLACVVAFATILSMRGAVATQESKGNPQLAAVAGQTTSDLEALRTEIALLRAAQEATARDLDAIKALLQQAMGPHPAPPEMAAAMPGGGVQSLTIARRPARGSPQAAVTLVEYADYECPYCAQYVTKVYPRIDREYIRTNKVRYVFKNYPIEQVHPRAFQAHVAAACAGDQGRYWEMHDKLFGDQLTLHLDRYVEHALALGLDAVKFRACVQSPAHDALIRADIDEAVNGGVRGTPVFILALTSPQGDTITPARVLVGAQPFQAFKDALDGLLAQATSPTR